MERTSEVRQSVQQHALDHPVAPKVNESDREVDSIVHKKPPKVESTKQKDPQSQPSRKSSARRS